MGCPEWQQSAPTARWNGGVTVSPLFILSADTTTCHTPHCTARRDEVYPMGSFLPHLPFDLQFITEVVQYFSYSNGFMQVRTQ